MQILIKRKKAKKKIIIQKIILYTFQDFFKIFQNLNSKNGEYKNNCFTLNDSINLKCNLNGIQEKNDKNIMNILIENGLISKEGKINSVILFGFDYISKFDSSNLPLSFINNFKKQIQYSLGDLIKKIN